MAKNRPVLEEAQEAAPVRRTIVPPPQDELNVPDTAETPPEVRGTFSAAEEAPVMAKGSIAPSPAQALNEGVPLEEAIDSAEKWHVVRPNTTFDTVIGHIRWYFVKDVQVKVPGSVRDILAHAKKIYP